MKYKDFLTNVVKTLRPGSTFDVTITSVEDLGKAFFVVAAIVFQDVEYTIPFIIYTETCIFMPFDWSGQLPLTADNIFCCKWVCCPDKRLAFIINGLSS